MVAIATALQAQTEAILITFTQQNLKIASS